MLVDIHLDPEQKGMASFEEVKNEYRIKIGNNTLSSVVAYYPWLETMLDYCSDESVIRIIVGAGVSASETKSDMVLVTK